MACWRYQHRTGLCVVGEGLRFRPEGRIYNLFDRIYPYLLIASVAFVVWVLVWN